MATVVLETHDRVLLTLHEACADRAAATLMSRDLLLAHAASVVDVVPDAVVLELAAFDDDLAFTPPAFCVVSFASGGRSWLFTSRIRQARAIADGRALVVLALPELIRGSDQRLAARVTVPPGVTVGATLQLGDVPERWTASVIDVSLCGALIALPLETSSPRPEARGRLDLTLDDVHASLRVVVRRIAAPRYGLYFPDAVVGGRLASPPQLRELVTRLLRAHHR